MDNDGARLHLLPPEESLALFPGVIPLPLVRDGILLPRERSLSPGSVYRGGSSQQQNAPNPFAPPRADPLMLLQDTPAGFPVDFDSDSRPPKTLCFQHFVALSPRDVLPGEAAREFCAYMARFVPPSVSPLLALRFVLIVAAVSFSDATRKPRVFFSRTTAATTGSRSGTSRRT
jgi:hypothetical protein